MRRFFEASALLAIVLFSAAAVASSPATDASSNRAQLARSVMTPAQILYAPKADFTQERGDLPHHANVVLQLNVGENGKAEDIKVIKSDDPALDGPVTNAVSKYRFRPATVDNQPIEAQMNLVVRVRE